MAASTSDGTPHMASSVGDGPTSTSTPAQPRDSVPMVVPGTDQSMTNAVAAERVFGNGTSQSTSPSPAVASKETEKEPMVVHQLSSETDEDDVVLLDSDDGGSNAPNDRQPPAIGAPPIKRRRENGDSPIPDDPKTVPSQPASADDDSSGQKEETPKKEPELSSYSDLLDRLEAYVRRAVDAGDNVERRVLDALLAAINIQVQREPYSVRKLILEKQLVLPNTISFPPSQVVEMVVEHDPEHQLSRVVSKLFGEERPKLNDEEKRERQVLKAHFPAPAMTKLLVDLGQELVKEVTYSDIVHARNLPETPKNLETYKQVAAQLRPVWEQLRRTNEPFHRKCYDCHVCGFRTDSRTVISIHRSTLHWNGRKYQCAYCTEFDTNENRIIRHYITAHGIKPTKRPEEPLRVECPICEEDFLYKGHRDQHLKQCRKDVHKIRTVQAVRGPEHITTINRWLWDKPPVEQSIIAQQQQAQQRQQQEATAQRAQQLKLQKEQQRRLAAVQQRQQQERLAAAAQQRLAQQQLLLQQQQQQTKLQQQKQGQVLAALLKQMSTGHTVSPAQLAQLCKAANITQEALQAALQAHLRQQQQQRSSATSRHTPPNASSTPTASKRAPTSSATSQCEICDNVVNDRAHYLKHLQGSHKQLMGKSTDDMVPGAPLACSRCRERFWTYEGLERHLVMAHGLVTTELFTKAQKAEDGGRCRLCGKQYAFNMLKHLVTEHKMKLCSAEIMYSCDVCAFKCSSYQKLESHLSNEHPKNPTAGMGQQLYRQPAQQTTANTASSSRIQ